MLNTPHKELEEMLGRLASQGIAAANLLSIRELERTFAAAGVDRITTSVGKEIHPKYADAAVEQSWLKAVSDDIFLADPQLSKFTQAAHSRSQEGFVELDHRHLKTAAERINRAAAEAAIEAMNAHREETDLLRRQAALKRRHGRFGGSSGKRPMSLPPSDPAGLCLRYRSRKYCQLMQDCLTWLFLMRRLKYRRPKL